MDGWDGWRRTVSPSFAKSIESNRLDVASVPSQGRSQCVGDDNSTNVSEYCVKPKRGRSVGETQCVELVGKCLRQQLSESFRGHLLSREFASVMVRRSVLSWWESA